MRKDRQRTAELGAWGERKAFTLLARAGFVEVRNVNSETHNHPFGDIYAERNEARYLIGVKTRNKYQITGRLNPTYNVRKKGAEVWGIARHYNAELAWVAVQVVPEKQVLWSYFGTIDEIQEAGERFSIPMQQFATAKYECLANEEIDPTILPEWSNGGYAGIL